MGAWRVGAKLSSELVNDSSCLSGQRQWLPMGRKEKNCRNARVDGIRMSEMGSFIYWKRRTMTGVKRF